MSLSQEVWLMRILVDTKPDSPHANLTPAERLVLTRVLNDAQKRIAAMEQEEERVRKS
jgi:hypothetical protein